MENREKILAIKQKLYSGEVTYGEAKELAKPILDEINKKIAEIAKFNNKKPYKISFGKAIR
jgi:hypothetical protein